MNHRDIFVYTPVNSASVALATAACRAGALGVVNFEFASSWGDVVEAISKISHPQHGARGPFAVKLATATVETLTELAAQTAGGLTDVIIDSAGLDELFADDEVTIPPGLTLWAEITGLGLPRWLSRIDGIVLKGNEAGGLVGEESAFILFQHWRAQTDLPLVVRGGMTPQAAAGVRALGAVGVAFDSQLLLLPEAETAAPVAALIEAMSGTETVAVGDPSAGRYLRILQHPRCRAAKAFVDSHGLAAGDAVMAKAAEVGLGWDDPATGLLLLGQEAALAKPYAETYGSLPKLITAVRKAVSTYPAIAAANPPITAGSPLADALGTGLPIIQGPMTRVSDNAEFAAAIAEGGALPMLALAVMRPAQVDTLLKETAARLGHLPWGVGFLGFLPRETLGAQIDVALKHKPNFAIIAGGRPDQAVDLEAQGIPAFLHVPSARLLGYFIENGARRFIFEGRECGGHIGPMSSFTLWSLMIDQILVEIEQQKIDPSELQCVFAGGVHDAASSALLQVMLAPLIEKGVRLGVIMGSAYVFTPEIVETGAVLPGFQDTMISSDDTVNLTTGPGHASRCARTPFVEEFFTAQQTLAADTTVPEDEKREKLDSMILGTLRAASKGQQRAKDTGELETLDHAAQYDTGMYMIGQVASLRTERQGITDLHAAVTDEARELLEGAADMPAPALAAAQTPADIAIIGLSCALPGAMTPARFWANILAKHDAIDEVPAHRWDWRLYFDEDRAKKDKIYSRWGGFLEDMPFDPMRYGITPKSLKSVDPMQLMGLSLADEALQDAGYGQMEKALKERTSVVLGASGGSGDVGLQYNLRSEYPRFAGDLPDGLADELPEWSEDTFAGILINVLSGRVSNRLDLGGANFTTDAACASSLAALYQAVNELRSGRSDMAIAGGVDTQQSPFGFMCFAQTGALSPTGRCQSFDTGADGIAISEGIVMFVLKRLEDAESAGDRIYAVLKGIGAGSDGKAKALNAPEPAGQLRAMKRAYDHAGYSADTVRLFEAHGTGTVAGDTAELQSTGQLVAEADLAPRQSVIGSVKTNIGHTKATAGLAGLLKIVLALHHGVLPPHRGVKSPNKVLAADDAPLYLLDEAEPWLAEPGRPRRASVSAFGFGGTNFHATVEGYEGEYRRDRRERSPDIMPAELVVLCGPDTAALGATVAQVSEAVASNSTLALRDVAAAAIHDFNIGAPVRAALVATDIDDLKTQLSGLAAHLAGGDLPDGVHLETTAAEPGKLAVLFPGQGSQYPFMGREVAVWFAEMAETLAAADTALEASISDAYGAGTRLSNFLFPRGAYTPAAQAAARKALTATDIAQPALGAVEAGLWRLLSEGFGLKGDMFAGHSYGEFAAHFGAGGLGLEDLMRVSRARGALIVEKAADAGSELGTMLAVRADRATVEAVVTGVEGLVVANHNAPEQVIVSGPTAAVEAAEKAFADRGIAAQSIPVAAAFHSALMAPARDALAEVVNTLDWRAPVAQVYSNQHAKPHAADPREAMVSHLVNSVNFVDQVEAMHADGARTFVEVGPKAVLSGLVGKILHDKPHRTIATDPGQGAGLSALLSALGQLAVAGVPLNLSRLMQGREVFGGGLAKLASFERGPKISKHAWWVNGSAAWPQKEPRPAVGVTIETKPEQAAPAPMPSAASTTHGGSADAPTPAQSTGAAAKAATHSLKRPQERQSMYNRPIKPDFQGHGSVSAAYFELVAHSLGVARDVAMAELGVELPATDPRVITDGGARPTHKRVPLRPVPQPVAAAAPMPTTAPAPQPVAAEATPAPVAAPTAPAPAPVAEAPAPEPTAAPATKGPLSEDALRKLLLATVSEKTGYDEDMVEFDQNLEADLGIDSIKRVDVVAGMMKALPDLYQNALGDEGRAKLSTSATLQEMLDALVAAGGAPVNFDQAGAGNPSVTAGVTPDHIPSRPDDMTTRYVVEARAEPLTAAQARGVTEGAFLVLPGPNPVTAAVAESLGAEVVPAEAMADEASLTTWLEANAERLGRLAGIVHLTPLAATPIELQTGPDGWLPDLFANEKTLFLALKHLKLDERGHALSASALGGYLGRQGAGPLTLAGGTVGLLKSLLRERETCRPRAVDLDPAMSAEEMAAIILDELALKGGRVEVGYPGGARHIFPTVEAALPDAFETAITPKVVLATGGARGITAETLRSIAAPGVTLLLTGRSAMPDEAAALRNDPVLAALTAEQDLAKHFVKVEKMSLGEGRKRAAQVVAAREMLDNVTDLTARGAEVRYLPVDVTDGEALRALVVEHGPIDTVVHGAGVIEDKFLGDITSDSWDRVVRTKVIGLLQMLAALDLEKLTSLVVYTSVAGRYGNAGQTSYATANELMNRLCCQLQAQLGDGVAVRGMNWGPWGQTQFGAGMVTPQTEAKFRAQGVHLVTAQQGRDLFGHAVLTRDESAVEVICGAAPWDDAEASRSAFEPARVELLPPAMPEALSADTLVQNLRVAEATPFLDDHRIDGTAVLPMAMALEIMAQSVVRGFGEGWKLIAIEDAKLFGGVQMDTPARDMLVRMVQKSHGMGETQVVSAKLFSADAPKRPHYGADFVLAPALQGAPSAPVFAGLGQAADRAGLYPQHLFHGPAFQMLSGVEGVGDHGLRARMNTAGPELLLGGETDLTWQFDPLLVDAIAQLPLAWISMLHGREVLPLQFERIERFAAVTTPELILDMTVIEHSPEAVVSEVIAQDQSGVVIMAVSGMRHAIRPKQAAAEMAEGNAA